MNTQAKRPCEFCAEGHTDDNVGYYEQKRCQRLAIWNAMMAESDPAKRSVMNKAYNLACYVGD